MKKTLLVLWLAAVHVLVSVVVIMLNLGAAMSGFEPGTKPVSPQRTALLDALARLLLFPIAWAASRLGMPSGLDYLLLFLNGLLWAAVIVVTGTRLRAASAREG
jgi:hypothetical protein